MPISCANLTHLFNKVTYPISHVAPITSGPWVIKSSFTCMLISQAKHYVFSHDFSTFNSLAPAIWSSNFKCIIYMPTKPKNSSTIRPWRKGTHMFNNILVARSKKLLSLENFAGATQLWGCICHVAAKQIQLQSVSFVLLSIFSTNLYQQ